MQKPLLIIVLPICFVFILACSADQITKDLSAEEQALTILNESIESDTITGLKFVDTSLVESLDSAKLQLDTAIQIFSLQQKQLPEQIEANKKRILDAEDHLAGTKDLALSTGWLSILEDEKENLMNFEYLLSQAEDRLIAAKAELEFVTRSIKRSKDGIAYYVVEAKVDGTIKQLYMSPSFKIILR
jgi:hypothetical protein